MKRCGGHKGLGIKPHDEHLDNFHNSSKSKDGKQGMCKSCRSTWNRSKIKSKLNATHNPTRYGENALPHRRSIYSICGARSRAERLFRYPSWITKQQEQQIKAIYDLRDRLNKCHVKPYWHVDHILPLVGKEISGLHIPENLQIIPAKDNLKKGASYEASIRH